MNLGRVFSKPRPPVGPWNPILGGCLFADFIFDLGRSRTSHDEWDFVFAVGCVVVVALVWPVITLRRLDELSLGRAWVIPLAALFALALFAAFEGQLVLMRVAAGIAILAHLPQSFLSRRNKQPVIPGTRSPNSQP
jgi:hypothetical protein